MAINTSALNSTLQAKVDALDAATDTKEVILLSKALEAAAGSISVSDVLAESVIQVNNVNNLGATKIAEINAVATNTLKTVGGTSILGSGDIATLPSGGSVGQVLKKDGSNNASWGADEVGKVLSYNFSQWDVRTSCGGARLYWSFNHNKVSPTSKLIVRANIQVKGQQNGNSGDYIQIDGTNYGSFSYDYHGSYGDATKQIHGAAMKVCGSGVRTVGVGWSASSRPGDVFNPNSIDDSRNNQKVSTIEVWEVEV